MKQIIALTTFLLILFFTFFEVSCTKSDSSTPPNPSDTSKPQKPKSTDIVFTIDSSVNNLEISVNNDTILGRYLLTIPDTLICHLGATEFYFLKNNDTVDIAPVVNRRMNFHKENYDWALDLNPSGISYTVTDKILESGKYVVTVSGTVQEKGQYNTTQVQLGIDQSNGHSQWYTADGPIVIVK